MSSGLMAFSRSGRDIVIWVMPGSSVSTATVDASVTGLTLGLVRGATRVAFSCARDTVCLVGAKGLLAALVQAGIR